MIINSKDNKYIKYLEKLYNKKYRDIENKFVVEGYHLIEEAYKKGILECIYKKDSDSFTIDVETYIINDKLFDKVSNLKNGNIIGICKKIICNYIGPRALILDNIQDPGNLGTIIRSAKAFNVDTIILSEDCVDIYNLKVLRATEGILFHINFLYDDIESAIYNLKNKEYLVCVTDVKDGKNICDIKTDGNIAIVVGNEGIGVKDKIKDICHEKIHIKMNSEVESLNVAMATTIILYELDKE